MDDDEFNFEDGWGDDNDIDLDLDDMDDDADDVHANANANVNVNVNGHENQTGTGNESDITGNGIGDGNVETSGNGWNNDSDNTSHHNNEEEGHVVKQAVNKLSSSPSSFDVNEGWDWEEEEEQEDTPAPTTATPPTLTTATSVTRPHPLPPPPPLPTKTKTKLEKQLIQYINDLSSNNHHNLLQKTNTKFNLLKNNQNPESALELCRYYHQRPQLTEYTIDKEVPRMEYQIMISDEVILMESGEIQSFFKSHPINNLVDDMLLRASNQSLLADIFPIITSDGVSDGENNGENDGAIIRNQFLATAVATKCRFVLDMRNTRTTQVECNMTLSIPYIHNEKLDLATLRFMVHFSPEPNEPFVEYQLVSIQPLLDLKNHNQNDEEKIHIASIVLQDLVGMDVNMMSNRSTNTTNNMTDTVRDNFLHSIESTQSGFKSAWKDIDGIVNVSSKLNYIKKVSKQVSAKALPVLPSAEDIISASNVGSEIEYSYNNVDPGVGTGAEVSMRNNGRHYQQSQQEQQQQQHQHHSSHDHPPPPPPRFTSQQQQQQQPPISARPIIGGLLLSGISQLAEAVTAPSDTNFHNNSIAQTKLYRKDTEDENQNVIQEKDKQMHQKNVTSSNHVQNSIVSSSLDTKVNNTGNNQAKNNAFVDVVDGEKIAANDNYSNVEDQEEENGWSDNESDIDLSSQSSIHDKIIDNSNAGNDNRTNSNDNNTAMGGRCNVVTNQDKAQMDSKHSYLISKMKELMEYQIKISNYVPQDFVYDENTSIIPTRKRFVSRSDMLNY